MKKLILPLTLIVLSSIFSIGWGIDQLFENYSNNTEQDIIGHYQTLGQQLVNSLDSIENKEAFLINWNKSHENPLLMTPIDQFPLPKKIAKQLLNGEVIVLESYEQLSLHYFLPSNQHVLTFNPDELLVKENASLISLLLTLFFYFSILLFILIWSYPLIRRLSQLRQTAFELGTGDLKKRIKLSNASYIKDIEKEFNRMANKIESLVVDNKLISSAVSHDLRTPLARLRLGLDVLSETNDQHQREKYQKRLSNDIDEMQSLIEMMLDYAKLEQSLVKVDKTSFDLIEFINKFLQNYSTIYESKIKILHKSNVHNIKIEGDKKYLAMLVRNLLDNANKYAKSNVLIEINTEFDSVVVLFHDDGNGVAKNQREKILKPFIKFESDGYGMGLAITERIAQWHHGSIRVNKSPVLGGALFEVRFPISRKNYLP